jgi:hypothetical protein
MTDTDGGACRAATQNVVDPRRLGKQNSGFSDEELSDIICLLIPCSEHARREVARIAVEGSEHLVCRDDAENVQVDECVDDDSSKFGPMISGQGEHALALRLSAQVKDPLQGFTFGRNPNRCDVCFLDDPLRRLSNIHFRIFVNEYSVIMLEDRSTNGTIVDETILQAKARQTRETMRTLATGSKIKVLMHNNLSDLNFLVRIPRREGEYEVAYRKNVASYLSRLRELNEDANTTIGPGNEGHVSFFLLVPPLLFVFSFLTADQVNLFPNQFRKPQLPRAGGHRAGLPHETTQENSERLQKAWAGSDKYHRVGEIGKGAFATVYKVTDKFNGIPYAAKELDKRKFMKNGVLDQKVENEMNIMQKIEHVSLFFS